MSLGNSFSVHIDSNFSYDPKGECFMKKYKNAEEIKAMFKNLNAKSGKPRTPSTKSTCPTDPSKLREILEHPVPPVGVIWPDGHMKFKNAVAVLLRYEDRDTSAYSSLVNIQYRQPIIFKDKKAAETWLIDNGYAPSKWNPNGEYRLSNNDDHIAVITELASSPEDAQYCYSDHYGHAE